MYLGTFKSVAAWNTATLVILLAVVALGVASCGQDERTGRPTGKAEQRQLTRGLAGQPGSLDPQRAEDAFSYDVLHDLYEGLTASTPDGEVIPAAATSWRIEAAGKVYVFLMRREARWSNGDPVTAANFVEGFRRALDPATVSGAADLLRSIENAPAILQGDMPVERLGVRAVDDYTLEIRLSHPLPYFPDILTNTVASPVHPTSVAMIGGIFEAGRDDFERTLHPCRIDARLKRCACSQSALLGSRIDCL